MYKIIIGLVLFIPTIVQGQMGFSYPYFLTSPNGQFYLKSIPYKSQLFETEGRTEMYASKDSSLIYSISRYFVPGELLISNDGKTMLHAKFDVYNDEDFD